VNGRLAGATKHPVMRLPLLAFLALSCAPLGCARRFDPARDLTAAAAACTFPGGPTVDVRGAVAHPGKYPLQADTTLRAALLAAGGLTSVASHEDVRVTRCSRSVVLNLDAIAAEQATDPAMRPGDEVVVEEHIF
jgi:polysaccharide biosynthesis/export protein